MNFLKYALLAFLWIFLSSCTAKLGNRSKLILDFNNKNHVIIAKEEKFYFEQKRNDSLKIKKIISLTGAVVNSLVNSEAINIYYSAGLEKINIISTKAWKNSNSKEYKFFSIFDKKVQTQNFYDGLRVKNINLPYSSDTLVYEIKYEVIYHNPNILSPIRMINDLPIKNYTVSIKNNTDYDIELFETGYLTKKKVPPYKKRINRNDSSFIHFGSISDYSIIKGHDIVYPHIQEIHFKIKHNHFIHDWKSFNKFFYSLNKENYFLSDSAYLKFTGKSNFSDTKKNLTKDLFELVKEKIRYEAFEYGIKAYKADKPDNVFHNKYADCKGVSFFLISLLRKNGIKAYPVLLSAGDDYYNMEYAKIYMANHVIVAVDVDNKRFWLDATDQYNSFYHINQFIANKNVLIIKDSSEYEYTRTPKVSATHNNIIWTVTSKLNQKNLEGDINIKYKGINASDIKRLYYNVKSENRIKNIKKHLESLLPGTIISKLTVSKMNIPESNIDIMFKFKKENVLNKFDKKSILNLNLIESLIKPKVSFYSDSTNKILNLLNSIELNIKIEVKNKYKKIKIPKSISVNTKFMSISSYNKTKHNIISLKMNRKIKKRILTEGEISDFKENLKKSNLLFNPHIIFLE